MSTSDGARRSVNGRHAIHTLVPDCLRLDLVALKINRILDCICIVLNRVSNGLGVQVLLIHLVNV